MFCRSSRKHGDTRLCLAFFRSPSSHSGARTRFWYLFRVIDVIGWWKLKWQRRLLCNFYSHVEAGRSWRGGFGNSNFGVLEKKRLFVRGKGERRTSVVYVSHAPGSTRQDYVLLDVDVEAPNSSPCTRVTWKLFSHGSFCPQVL